MKLPKNVLIEKACSADASRAVLNHAYLETDAEGFHKSRLIASDGYILACVPLLVDSADKNGAIPAEALKAARSSEKRSEEITIAAYGVCKLPNGLEVARPDVGSYPKVDYLFPRGEVRHRISLDPELLYRLAQAIGSGRGLTIEVIEGSQAYRVRPHTNSGAKTPKGTLARFAPACPDAVGLIMGFAG